MGPALSNARRNAVDLAKKLPFVRQSHVHYGQGLTAGVPGNADAICVGRILVHLLHGEVTVGDPHSSTSQTPLRFREIYFRTEPTVVLVKVIWQAKWKCW